MHSVEFLGITIHGATISELNEMIYLAILAGEKSVIANHNLHSLYLFHHDAKLRDFFLRAKLAHADGMSLIALARFFGHSLTRDQRVTYVDWVGPLMEKASTQGWRVFFVGSKPGVADAASALLSIRYPGLNLMVHHGYFDSTPESRECTEILKIINAYRPHLLMVGMGMPRQEHWILDNLHRIDANVILPAGACMDYIAGVVPTPPRWLGRVGLEWLYRLMREPRRLWARYTVEPWFIVKLLLKELCARRSDSSDKPGA